ncbi:MAG: hypothetical protein C4340_07965, partial [Armatimonadota bacterium]
TIKRCAGALVVKTLDRNSLYHAQTPQAANREALLAAMRAHPEATDEASALERAGASVRAVEGEVTNRKITTFHDLEGLLRVEHRTGLGWEAARPRWRIHSIRQGAGRTLRRRCGAARRDGRLAGRRLAGRHRRALPRQRPTVEGCTQRPVLAARVGPGS